MEDLFHREIIRAPVVDGQRDFTNSRTSRAWPGTLSPRHSLRTTPSGSTTKVLRSTPRTFLPYIFFIFMTPNRLQTFSSGSDNSSKGKLIFDLKPSCDLMLSRETP